MKSARTPESEFRLPILIVLEELGGSAKRQVVLERVRQVMGSLLTRADFEPVKSESKQPVWENTASWERKWLIRDGLLEHNSPHGIWALSQTGREYLRALTRLAS